MSSWLTAARSLHWLPILLDQMAVSINHIRELDEVLEYRVVIHGQPEFFELFLVLQHLLFGLVGRIDVVVECVAEDGDIDFLEAAERVHGATISLRSLKEVLSPRVEPLVRILSGATTTSSTGWRIS